MPRLAPIGTFGALAVACVAGALFHACRSDQPVAPGPTRMPGTTAWLEEVASQRGLDFVHVNGHRDRYLMPENVGSGAALFDMDGDGDLDAYLVQAGDPLEPARNTPNRLFRNVGAGHFEDATAASGTGDRGYGMGVAVGDYDGDGLSDLYVTNFGPNVLYRNEGGGRFTDVSTQAGVDDPGWGASASFFDYDRDGDLDLYVLNYLVWRVTSETPCYNPAGLEDYCGPTSYDAPARDVLYRNGGDGRFEDVTEAAGVTELGNGLGVVAGDFNGDGWPDLFVANDGMSDRLWVNLSDGRFEERGLISGCALDSSGKPTAGMGVTAADYDDDGDLDVMVANLVQESDTLFRNDGAYFVDATASAGLMGTSRPFTRFGMAWADFDNDGRLDLYQVNGRVQRQAEVFGPDPYAEPNLLFQGSASGRFEEVIPRGGTAQPVFGNSRGAAFGDVDGDGGIDVLVANNNGVVSLFLNVLPDRGHWLTFDVRDERGAAALGASVRLALAGREVVRDVRAGYSYMSSNDPRVHIGLAAETRIESVTVVWPAGPRERFGPFEADQIVTLRRGRGTSVAPGAAR